MYSIYFILYENWKNSNCMFDELQPISQWILGLVKNRSYDKEDMETRVELGTQPTELITWLLAHSVPHLPHIDLTGHEFKTVFGMCKMTLGYI